MKKLIRTAAFTLISLFSVHAVAGGYYHNSYNQYQPTKNYKVTITNITKGISFTPLLVATHNRKASFFTVGEPASDEVGRIAEGGDISGLKAILDASENVHATTNSDGLLNPGESVELMIDANRANRRISITSMLLPTNDTLVALLGKRLPRKGKTTFFLNAYDGGTETNNENCAYIPGPHCGGTPFSPEDEGEGYIYPSPAIHGEADLSREAYNWDGAVAKVTVELVH